MGVSPPTCQQQQLLGFSLQPLLLLSHCRCLPELARHSGSPHCIDNLFLEPPL
jgi:hypothetical protein